MKKKVTFASNVKDWDGICYKSRLFEHFIITFSKIKIKYINKLNVERYIKKYSGRSDLYKENLEHLFNTVSELIKSIKKVPPGERVPFLPRGGGKIKFLTSYNLDLLDLLDNALIELIFT